MGALNDHIACRVNENQRRVARVGFHKPDNNRDVVGDALERHRNRAVSLEEVDGATVVVREDSSFRLQRRVGFGEVQQVLPDVPLHILGVRQRRRPPLRQHAVEKLLDVLRHSIQLK